MDSGGVVKTYVLFKFQKFLLPQLYCRVNLIKSKYNIYVHKVINNTIIYSKLHIFHFFYTSSPGPKQDYKYQVMYSIWPQRNKTILYHIAEYHHQKSFSHGLQAMHKNLTPFNHSIHGNASFFNPNPTRNELRFSDMFRSYKGMFLSNISVQISSVNWRATRWGTYMPRLLPSHCGYSWEVLAFSVSRSIFHTSVAKLL